MTKGKLTLDTGIFGELRLSELIGDIGGDLEIEAILFGDDLARFGADFWWISLKKGKLTSDPWIL